MRRSGLASVVLALTACASDPGTFRPASGAPEQPPVATAYRVKQVAPECLYLGVVHADGAYAIENMAITAARHGGTEYVVAGDDKDERRTQVDPGTNELVTTTNHKMWAKVYRCPK
jgi:hypothetical protein